MKNTDRFIAFVLCFTLTLGAFAYRPSEAKAIAGVDDAVVIGALLSAFAGGCGLIFSNNGMSSDEIAGGLSAKWDEYKAMLERTPSNFADWLGYEDMDSLITDLRWDQVKECLEIPRAVARKFADFTTWLTDNLGVTAGGEEKSVASSNARSFSTADGSAFTLGSSSLDSTVVPYGSTITFPNGNYIKIGFYSYTRYGTTYEWYGAFFFNEEDETVSVAGVKSSKEGNFKHCDEFMDFWWSLIRNDDGSLGVIYNYKCVEGDYSSSSSAASCSLADFQEFAGVAPIVSRLSVFAPSYYQNPTIDLPTEGEEAANPTLSGVGDGTATTIEDLLQQILAQLQVNTLAPTLDVAGTETGGNTDTDEDAKPYLPYIPQIFEKIKDLPGTLSNIWESIKGIPAAIAEKIGAFFTTLWGWLQSIIDAITALPAAIAEKVGELFKPDEALITEITDTFKGKFGFLPTLKQFGDDLFGMTAETEPPVVWIHLENAESKYGYIYGDKTKALDLSWYQKYKANVDTIVSGFLWLAFLWLLFKRASSIIQGGEMVEQYSADISAGHREKGGKRK